jgi:hypothetical protein
MRETGTGQQEARLLDSYMMMMMMIMMITTFPLFLLNKTQDSRRRWRGKAYEKECGDILQNYTLFRWEEKRRARINLLHIIRTLKSNSS